MRKTEWTVRYAFAELPLPCKYIGDEATNFIFSKRIRYSRWKTEPSVNTSRTKLIYPLVRLNAFYPESTTRQGRRIHTNAETNASFYQLCCSAQRRTRQLQQRACMGAELCYKENWKTKIRTGTDDGAHALLPHSVDRNRRSALRYHTADTPFLLSLGFWSNTSSQSRLCHLV